MKWLIIPLSLAVLILGVLTFWLPIPVGLPLMLLGSYLLLKHSTVARRAMACTLRRSARAKAIYRKIQALKGIVLHKVRGMRNRPANLER